MPTLDYQITDTLYDGRNYSGNWGFSSSTPAPFVGYKNDADVLVAELFICFQNVQIGTGATIDVAYLQFWGAYSPAGTPSLRISGIDENDPAPPTTAGEFATDKGNNTTAYVDWSGAWPINQWSQSPDISTIIQELYDNHGLAGERMMLQLWDLSGTGNNYNYPANYHSVQYPTKGPKIHIEYSTGGGGGGRAAIRGLATGLRVGLKVGT